MERRAPKPSACAAVLYRPARTQDEPCAPQAHLHLKASLAWTPEVFSVFSGRSSPLCAGGLEDEDALSSDGLVQDQV